MNKSQWYVTIIHPIINNYRSAEEFSKENDAPYVLSI
jgi:hypothetical protein